MDPDQANALGALDWSRSIRILIRRPVKRENGSGLGQPDPGVYIKWKSPGFIHFCETFLFLLLFSPAVLFSSNPKPNFVETTQKLGKLGLIVLILVPKHGSGVEIRMSTMNLCRFVESFTVSNRFRFVRFEAFSREILMDSLIYNGGKSLWISESPLFWKKLGFHHFRMGKASNPMNPHRSGVRHCSWMRRGKFLWLLPDFVRRFDSNLWNTSIWCCFYWFLAWIPKWNWWFSSSSS